MSAPQAVVVDDADPRIKYVTAWYHQEGQGTDFDQTISVSGNQGAVFEFTFTGTSIAVFGSVPANDTAVSTYQIDLSTPVTFVYPNLTQYTSRQLLYHSDTLPDGSHTLTVIAPDSVIGDPWTPLWFDYLTYIPSPSSTSSPTTSTPSSEPTSQNNVSPQASVQAEGAGFSTSTSSSSISSPTLVASPSSSVSSAIPTLLPEATSSHITLTSTNSDALSLSPLPASSISLSSPSITGSALKESQSPSPSKSADLKIIVPAVLVSCLLFVILLVSALYVQRKRLLASLQQKPAPYRGIEEDSSWSSSALPIAHPRTPVTYLKQDNSGPISPQSSTTYLTSDPEPSPLDQSQTRHFNRGSMFAISVAAETAPPPYSS